MKEIVGGVKRISCTLDTDVGRFAIGGRRIYSFENSLGPEDYEFDENYNPKEKFLRFLLLVNDFQFLPQKYQFHQMDFGSDNGLKAIVGFFGSMNGETAGVNFNLPVGVDLPDLRVNTFDLHKNSKSDPLILKELIGKIIYLSKPGIGVTISSSDDILEDNKPRPRLSLRILTK